jgi:hypothetical protein
LKELLERGLAVVAALHPDLEVLGKPLKLPLVQAAIHAISTNTWDVLEGVCFDADMRTEGTYRPDLVVLNRKTRRALIIDLKRSLAAYGDSTRLADLKRIWRRLYPLSLQADWPQRRSCASP